MLKTQFFEQKKNIIRVKKNLLQLFLVLSSMANLKEQFKKLSKISKGLLRNFVLLIRSFL